MIQSLPSFGRTIAAYSVYATGGIAAVAWKLLRHARALEAYTTSDWLVGVMPNLLPAAVLPALIFIRPQAVRFHEYLNLVVAILLALVLYETAQIWMPSRTFDLADIVASFLGAGLGCLLCWLVFFCWLGDRGTKHDVYH